MKSTSLARTTQECHPVAPMRVRILVPMKGTIDGIDLTHFEVGQIYDVGTTLANYLLASGYARPVADKTQEDDGVTERSHAHERDRAADQGRRGPVRSK
jgi:hypothetical protein